MSLHRPSVKVHGVGALEDGLRGCRIVFAGLVLSKQIDDATDFGVLAVDRAKAVHVVRQRRVVQRGLQLIESQSQAFELLSKRVFHGVSEALP